MDNRIISILIMERMKDFTNLIKVINNERQKSENILTEKQFIALAAIRDCEKIELKNLSKILHVSTSSLCILLNKLVEHGYAYREEDIRDRRNTFYGITNEGNEVLSTDIENLLSIISKKVDKLDEEDKNNLFTYMNGVNDIMRKLF